MHPETDFRPAAYALIALGASLAFVAAVVPHYDAGYRLDLPLLLAGLAPYLVYGVLTEFWRNRWLLVAGVVLLALELLLRIPLRLLRDGYPDTTAHAVPLIAAGALALAAALGARGRGDTPPPPPAPEESSD